jgi:Tropinone reductase 1
MWNLENKRILVTGGTKGIGRATVIELLNLGATVLFTARDRKEVAEFEKELQQMNLPAFGVVSDVSSNEDQLHLQEWIKERWKGLDGLVNNAGFNIRKSSIDFTREDYQRVINVNLLAPFELSRRLFPYLLEGKNPVIVNVASVAGILDVHTGSAYAMSKAGLIQQTRNLAVEWAKFGIRVNAVSPWVTETPLTRVLLEDQKKIEKIIERTPMQRVARPEEMASVIAFLMMDKSSYINGQNLIVDGGMSVNAL